MNRIEPIAATPTSWTWSRLSDVSLGVFDCPHSTPQYADHGPYLARTQDVATGVFRSDLAARVTPQTYAERTARAIPTNGDLLYSREGTYFGVAAEVPPGIDVCLGQRMVLIRPRSEVLNHRFARLWLNSDPMAAYVKAHSDGSVAQRLNLPVIRGIPIPIPPLREQESIAATLGALDDKVESNRRAINLAEEVVRARFGDLFDIHHVPDGVPISGLVDINPRRNLPAGTDATYVGMSSLPEFSAEIYDWVSRPAGSGQRFVNGDVLMARITPCLENGKTAVVDMVEEGMVGWGSTEYVVLSPRPDISTPWIYCLVRSEEIRSFTIRSMSGTSGRQRFQAERFKQYKIPRPSAEALLRFNSFAIPIFRRMTQLRDESNRLAALRDALLPELLSGRIRVPEATEVVQDVVDESESA